MSLLLLYLFKTWGFHAGEKKLIILKSKKILLCGNRVEVKNNSVGD